MKYGVLTNKLGENNVVVGNTFPFLFSLPPLNFLEKPFSPSLY